MRPIWAGAIKFNGEYRPRIIAIADVYEALISDRPYRKALSKKEALKIIKENSGTRFDPKVAGILIDVLKKRKA